ncbi:actin-like protein arp8 [Apophysomyces sp. BC1034]|nr:actin-like protein arp8 [Apophysomyces sp. BC1015]KAG0180228.1 actin-like protein arp8 [Apophysomyces sp. BC1021]KAG0190774.1 actin-like protein arp8 [Apophysomyces sp. BC1034]
MADNSHTNTFLKTLSQKKYAWMQSAAQSTTQPATSAALPVRLTSSDHIAVPKTLTDSRKPMDEPGRTTKKPRQSKRGGFQEYEANTTTASPVVRDTPAKITSPVGSPVPQFSKPYAAVDDTSAEHADEMLSSRRKKHRQPHFKYTTFPVKGFNILPTRNITSTFARSDTTYFPGNKAGSEAIAPDADEEWRDTIVIHPGSRNLRIGCASEAFPKTVPHVIARRMHTTATPIDDEIACPTMDLSIRTDGEKNSLLDEDDSDASSVKRVVDVDSLNFNREEALREIKNELKWRMKNAKRRAVPNAEGQVVGFNTQAFQETIPDHNDPYKVEWTEIQRNTPKPEYFVGDKALNLPISENSDYRLFYPWKHGTLNNQDYRSLQAVIGDLQAIWTETIRNELEIDNLSNYNAVLVVPDLYPRGYVNEIITMMLRYMNFRGVLVQQESICATFGAGVSSACVVDIGAQQTSIACIEDGVCLVDSRASIAIGGDDITKTFTSFLLANRFPYADINLAKSFDWRLAEELKEKWCTMSEADISVQVYDFFVRVPHQPTKKYQCKVYDEVFLAPLCLMYPAILDAEEKTRNVKFSTNSNIVDDIADEPSTSQAAPAASFQRSKMAPSQTPTPRQMSGSETPLTTTSTAATPMTVVASPAPSTAARTNSFDLYPVDVAIAQSIQTASGASDERLKRFFTNIILVGGAGMISNFTRVLEDRVLSTVVAQSASIERVEILPAPRELDPRLLVWKGASVLSKLDTAKDMWIGEEEWDEIGARCLKERALFM